MICKDLHDLPFSLNQPLKSDDDWYIRIFRYVIKTHEYKVAQKKCIHSLLINIFGMSYDSVWMPMVATSNTYIESKIQGHLSYQFCFSINTVVTIIK